MIPIIRPTRVVVSAPKPSVKPLEVDSPEKTKTLFITRPRTNRMPINL